MSPDVFHEMVEAPPGTRVYRQICRPALGDCAPSGRARLDALARWLQDVAYADVEDAGVAASAVWVVRRTRMRVQRFPRFGEQHAVATYCSGIGPMWAERRTTITPLGGSGDGLDGDGIGVDAVAIWVHLDPVAKVPSPLTQAEVAAYSRTATKRRVTARLRHRGPGAVDRRFGWTFRETECDLAGHVNNVAYWQPIEQDLLTGEEPERIDVEIEYRSPAQPGEKTVLCEDGRRWIMGETAHTLWPMLQGPARG